MRAFRASRRAAAAAAASVDDDGDEGGGVAASAAAAEPLMLASKEVDADMVGGRRWDEDGKTGSSEGGLTRLGVRWSRVEDHAHSSR